MSEHQPTRYTIVGNHLTQHRELSLTAIGLGAHIQSLPDGARVDIRTLAGKFPEGRDRIAAALRELEQHGYLERVRERTSEGRIVTRTFSYNAPETTRARRRAGKTRPREAVTPPAPPPQPAPGLAPPPRTNPGSLAPAPPAGAVPPAPPVPPSPPPAPVPVRTPAPPHPPATQADPAPLGTRARAATSLLAELRRHDDRLLLPERDVRRLAPAVTTWLERGATPEAVRRTLSTNLPSELCHPVALLAHRLTALLPPPLPVAQPTPPRPAVVPLQNCDGCDRAFRSPGPGLCRGCREPEDAVTPTAA
ncbi:MULTISPECIES: helix-turn-helix domain-containing protein [Streptomyces]|uniref:helix-turn-helix domain-containing protein n=1 Tax=Streptomyces lycopersici TaxID=2974589 RepID=UPI003525C45C